MFPKNTPMIYGRDSMLQYRFAEEKDLTACVDLLTDSFFDYPYFSNFIDI